MKFIKKINSISDEDMMNLQLYLNKNSDRPITEVYSHIKSIPLKKRTKTENLVFVYLYFNRKRFGIK